MKFEFSTLFYTKDDGSLVIDLGGKNTIYIITEVKLSVTSSPAIETTIVTVTYTTKTTHTIIGLKIKVTSTIITKNNKETTNQDFKVTPK